MKEQITDKNLNTYWDTTINEYEVDSSWSNHPIYHSKKYEDYRNKWIKANKGQLITNFPLNIEVEPTYYCNLKCPFCPRYAKPGERQNKHMSEHVWEHIIEECKENNLPSMQMDHEAEAMMNPKFFEMLEETQKAGILETWLHTNGMMLNEKNAKKLIQFGLKKNQYFN